MVFLLSSRNVVRDLDIDLRSLLASLVEMTTKRMRRKKYLFQKSLSFPSRRGGIIGNPYNIQTDAKISPFSLAAMIVQGSSS